MLLHEEDGGTTAWCCSSGRGRRAEAAPGQAGARSGAPRRSGRPGDERSRTATCSGIEPLEPSDIQADPRHRRGAARVLDRPIKKVPALRGKTVVNLFYEASTRTRVSFEIAEKRALRGQPLDRRPPPRACTKGETLLDTAQNLEAMNPDMIVICATRASGAPHFLARHCRSAIVNAGDGAHEHPTQALLDALTLRQKKGRLEGLRGRDRGRRAAQPRGALEHLAAHQDGRRGGALRPADADAARDRERWRP